MAHDVPIRVDHVGIAVPSIADAEPVLAALGCEKLLDERVRGSTRRRTATHASGGRTIGWATHRGLNSSNGSHLTARSGRFSTARVVRDSTT